MLREKEKLGDLGSIVLSLLKKVLDLLTISAYNVRIKE